MNHSHTTKYALLALGLSMSLGACGGDPVEPMAVTYSANIQKDMAGLSCLAVGCHDKNSTTKLKIDVAAGMEMANYNSLFTQMLVTKGDGTGSPLVKVPSTGVATTGASHVKTLSGTKLTDWTNWINAQAPF
jgi:hypothetical protein